MAENKKDFANTGTESYKISSHEGKKESVVLNIQEEKSVGVVLEKSKGRKYERTGTLFWDIYNRLSDFLITHSKVKVKDKAAFFHLLAVMVNSGIPMVKSLKSLAAQMENSPRLKMILDQVSSDIEAGSSLSEAMFEYSDVFTEQEVGMIQSGEASGQLSGILESLAKDTEKAYSIKSKVKSAMMYPTVVFVLLILVVAALMIFVVPKLTSLFEANATALPLITRVVVAVSDFMVKNQVAMLVGILGLVLFVMMAKRTAIGRFVFDNIKIKIPIFGAIFKKAYLSRFSRSLSNLLGSSISIVRAVEITANSIGNEVYKRKLLLSMEDIKQGIPLAESLMESPLFPLMLVNMIEVGERTAQMEQITNNLANFYEEEVDTTVAGLSKILEPIILVVIGLTVGAVIAAIMLPIMQLSDMAGSM